MQSYLEDSITGLIHTAASITTVILDGGYVLGKFGCANAAVDMLTDIQIRLYEAEKESGTYTDYKKNVIGVVVH